MNAYMNACTWLSEKAFDSGVFNARKLQSLWYETLRSQFGLKSQMAISVTRTVSAKYKAVDEQLKSQSVQYDKYTFKRNIEWLWHPIIFQCVMVDLVRTRDWCFKKDRLSLNTVIGRIDVPFNCRTNRGVLNKNWNFGTGTIHNICNKWYFYVPITIETPNEKPVNIIGVDRGLKNIVYTYDSNGTSIAIDGHQVQQKRNKFQRTRKSLQSKNTKGAKRVLKRIAKRENRWMNDVNHCLSKTLVTTCGTNSLFVLEDLSKISYKTHKGRTQNYALSSWSFYDLEQKLTYKARLNQSDVMHVNPHNTSCRCPACGNIDKKARYREQSLYCCTQCGFTANDDLVGAMNIYQRGINKLQA